MGEMTKPLIMVVEDNLAMLDGLRDLLEIAEYRVSTASGGDEALEMLKEEQQSKKPRPEAIQLLYLLQSTLASVASIGARFRIFCPEETKTPA